MSMHLASPRRKTARLLAGAMFAVFAPSPLHAATMTACTTLNLCYCVNKDLLEAINANVAHVRQLIVDQRAQGKAIGYLSIPISTLGGSYFGVNRDIGVQAKARIEKRYGVHSVWMLDPGAEGNLPAAASGADYMLQWTKILEGRNGLGEDFDFVYFVGPATIGQFFALDGNADMEKIETYFDKRAATDEGLKKAIADNTVTKASFRNYYALRASVSFSAGSHDEWNIARLINERRRGANDFGIGRQIAILFDGSAVSPGDYETAAAPGNAGRCVN
jgi:hypothetical protein